MTTLTDLNTTTTQNLPIDEEAAIFLKDIFTETTNSVDKLRKFSDFIRANLSDFDSRNQLMVTYPYEILLCVIIFARMAGNITKNDIREYWELHNEEINKVFPFLFFQIPSTSTITRALHHIEAPYLQKKMLKLFSKQYNFFRHEDESYFVSDLSKRDVIGCDGQAIRATARTRPSDGRLTGAMDITSLVSYNTGITLGHSIHQKKNQEAKAIIDMIKDTDITNAILTWDALNTHEITFKAAIDKGADVYACLKENQGSLYDDCITAYTEYKKGHQLYASTASQQIADYSHVEGGKHIVKNIIVLDAKLCISKELLRKWEFIKSVSFIETETTNLVTNKTSKSLRVFISTIPLDLKKYPNIAKDFLEISLKRWCVETLHWHLDMCFEQDRTSFRMIDSAFCSTMINKMVMNVFNFAKNAYANEEDRYKGVATTRKLQHCCSGLFDYSLLLLEAFCKNDPKMLTQHELSRKFHFMKTEIYTGIYKDYHRQPYQGKNTIFKDCPLLDLLNNRNKEKKNKSTTS